MITNFLKIIARVARKQASYSLLNIIGFSIGIATTLIITFYVSLQLSYESFNENANRIVRITEKIRPTGVGQASASVPIPVGPQLAEDFPHLVEKSVRLFKFESPLMLSRDDVKFNEEKIFFSDNDAFPVFALELKSGNEQNVLNEPNQIILSETLALKYFNSTEVLGKILRYDDRIDLKVTGVMADARTNSHFHPTAIISFETLTSVLTERQRTSWFWNPAYTYVLLRSESMHAELESQLDGFMRKYFNETKFKNKFLELQPLRSIFLHSAFDNELEPVGSWMYLRIIIVIGGFVLLLAIVNFVNLSTARAMNRAREIGVRKVLGSVRGQIVLQFLFESCSFTVVATAIGTAAALFCIPFVNEYLGLNIVITPDQHWILYSLLPLAIVVGILAGTYPAIYLSGFRPVQVLKGRQISSDRGILRRALVVVQFVITIALIVSSLVVWSQFNFLKTKDIGFTKENIIIIPIQRSAIGSVKTFQAFKSRVALEDGVVSVTGIEDIVGKGHNSGAYTPEGTTDPVLYARLFVREDFTTVFGIKVIAGQTFKTPYENPADVRELMINESMIKTLGWSSPEEAVGKKMGEIAIDGNVIEQRVIGVFKDFNFVSLHNAVEPLVLEAPPTDDAVNLFMIKYIAVRVKAEKQKQLVSSIGQHWNALAGGKIFEYGFLEDQLAKTYAQEDKLSRMNNVFSCFALLVSCMGLIGLASYSLEQRKKEVSIRKVLGSSATSIAVMLTHYFVRILLIASVIAIPLTYFALDAWLSTFAYHISVSPAYFVVGISFTLLIAVVVTAYQSLRAALTNPLKSLRPE